MVSLIMDLIMTPTIYTLAVYNNQLPSFIILVRTIIPDQPYNENVSSNLQSFYSTIASSYVPQQQYHASERIMDQVQPHSAENTSSSSFNSLNMPTQTNHSGIFSFDIPGFKIIIVPISYQQNHTLQIINFSIELNN